MITTSIKFIAVLQRAEAAQPARNR
jgi:hypothetical protein